MQSLFELIEHTNRSVFLTGKAGTGKTTFLNEYVKKTHKKYIVVAPTGIAAINAEGVTIHSMFGLPLRTFVPTFDEVDRDLANNIQDLSHHFKYRRDKLKLLREIEIIIVDEVSMLRADLLDMMDLSLKSIRRNPLPFGGVQMLFIGDLFQLPPVVRAESEYILSQYYKSPFFFEAKVLQDAHLLTVELTTVYRQKDKIFLNLLNHIRNGNIDEVDFDLLNQRYDPYFEPDKESYVYLCSHNKIADGINQKKLHELKTPSYFFDAIITGDFKESQFPNEKTLELKEGAQIMFIRNDTSSNKEYFNGKLAQVLSINKDEITVNLDGSNNHIVLKKEIWEQKRYYLDKERNIQEEILGSYEQYPVRLAWAVTIHKSQGLTFDRLIIDAGRSFASGQVYVALSRCRTLEGIVLKSKITQDIIFSDQKILDFHESTIINDKIESIVQDEKYAFAINKVMQRINMLWIKPAVDNWLDASLKSTILDHDKVREIDVAISKTIDELIIIYNKLEKIVDVKFKAFIKQSEDWEIIENKLKGAANFYFTSIYNKIFEPLKKFYSYTKGEKGLKSYNIVFKALLEDLEEYLNQLKVVYLFDKLLIEEIKEKDINIKVEKIPSHVVSFQLFEQEKTIEQIARERNLSERTIYQHLSVFATKGLLNLERIISKEKIKNFEKVFTKHHFTTLSEWKNILPDDYDFDEIKILLNHFNYLRDKKT